MKKLSDKQRKLDVKNGLIHRSGKSQNQREDTALVSSNKSNWKSINNWIDKQRQENLNITIDEGGHVILHLPEIMNFFGEYKATALYISAIRKLSNTRKISNKAYKLKSVNFDDLKTISTSAALVLTAELSKWDDAVRQRLSPNINNWDDDILEQFTDLGFFELFQNNPIENITPKKEKTSTLRLVEYIKGRCGDSKKVRILKDKIKHIVGDNIKKWTFLHSGLTEAITNVSHHAYPDEYGCSKSDKNWYLTGSYNDETKELKIVFFDQGIGIPKSLPESEVWEKVLKILDKLNLSGAGSKKDEVLLKAAVELDRTSTDENDRGKGLQDLLEFIRKRGNGYLSILSLKGLYKFSVYKGQETVKSECFANAIGGTLIIWSATLDN